MAENRTPVKRSDVIHCENCGEDYSVTYKRCPFCDEINYEQDPSAHAAPTAGSRSAGRRVAPRRRRSRGEAALFAFLRVAGVVIPLALIVAAIYIMISVLGPMITAGHGEDPDDTPSPGVESPLPSDSGQPAPSDDPVVVTPVPSDVTSITLNKSDFTLAYGESYRIEATLAPAGSDAIVVWTADNDSALTVAQDGTVTNTNTAAGSVTVTVTASCGDVSATCLVRCRPGGGTTASPAPSPSASGSPAPSPSAGQSGGVSTGAAVITNAGGGLRVRSGPGTSYSILASLVNGDKVTVDAKAEDGWYEITFSGSGGQPMTGYVKGEYLSNR